MTKLLALLLIIYLGISSSCSNVEKKEALEYPDFYNNSETFFSPEFPKENPSDSNAVALGKILFHSKQLSKNGTISCSSCHNPEIAFANNDEISIGINGIKGFRNVPTLNNVFHHNRLHADGGVPTLEMQVMAPIHNLEEMGFKLTTAAKELNENEELRNLALQCFQQEINPYVITRAIAAFERTLVSSTSRFDDYITLGKTNALNKIEKQGADIFYSEKAKCSTCHSGPNFSNYEYYNIGLSDYTEDYGRERVTLDSLDRGKFKVPSLRNSEITFPYMHDGSVSTLQEVIAFFNKGGNNHWNKSELIQPLGLSLQEEEALKAFLLTLTDKKYLEN